MSRPSFITCPSLARPHAFTTRAAGHLASGSEEDWKTLLQVLAPGLRPNSLALLTQVHGAEIVRVVRGGGPRATIAEADAAFTTEPDVVLAVRTADCVPVLLQGAGVSAVAHAGWRGTALDIVGALVARLRDELGAAPAELIAAIGPAISGAAYEVGQEVVDGLRASGLPEAAFLVPGFHPPHVDLQSAVAAQLRRAGVMRIDVVRRCTYTDPELFSYRREASRAGRQAGILAGPP